MNILITGGAGFIGSHLTSHHIEKNDHVWVVDNLSSGRKENLIGLNPSLLRFDIDDLLTWKDLETAINWADRIYHMAAIVGQHQVISNPLKTLHCNIHGCERLLETSSHLNKKTPILIASTSALYRQPTLDAYNEKDTLQVLSGEYIQQSYSLSKVINESMALAYHKQHQLPCIIARLFNVVGTHQISQYGMVIPTLIQQALNNAPMTIFGNGHQTRSFCNIVDIVKACDLLLSTPKSHGEIVNLGSDSEISIYELALLIKRKTKSKSNITFIPYKEAYGIDYQEIYKQRPNVEKLYELTGWRCQIPLEHTIDSLIANLPT
jgi:UDP-glucose 4-epimerase